MGDEQSSFTLLAVHHTLLLSLIYRLWVPGVLLSVRQKVKELVEFVKDDEKLREERKKAKKNKDKYVGMSGLSASMRYGESFQVPSSMATWHILMNNNNSCYSGQVMSSRNYTHTHARTHARTHAHTHAHTHTHTHTFNGPFSRTTQVSRYQKGKNQSGFY